MLETFLVEVDDHVQDAQVLDLLTQISHTVVADAVVVTSKVRQPVIAGQEDYFKARVLLVNLLALQLNVVRVPVDAHEPTLRVRLYNLQQVGRLFAHRVEFLVVSFGARVRRNLL